MLTGSINGAAKLLFVSQPAVSRIISHTEQSLGYLLFQRSKGKLVPTVEGEALFGELDDFYQYVNHINEFAANLARGPSHTFNISSSPCLSYSVVPAAIAQFVQHYPRIKINYHTALLHTMAAELLSTKVDLVVSVLPLDHPNLKVQSFAHGRMVCVIPSGHELASLDVVDLADLAKHSLITHHHSIQFGKMLEEAADAAGVKLKPRVTILQTETACPLVRTGVGIAIVDEYTARSASSYGLEVRPIAQEIVLTPSVARSIFQHSSDYAEKFIEILVNQNSSS